MRLVLKLLLTAGAFWFAIALVDGLTYDAAWWKLLVVAAVFAVVNAVVKPIATVLSFPAIVLTLGLFLLVVNTAMLWLTLRISEEFGVVIDSTGFGATFLGALVITLVVWAGDRLIGDERR